MTRALGLEVAALALVTKFAGGSPYQKLSHQEVLACALASTEPFRCLIRTLLSEFISDSSSSNDKIM